jgi:hypothetical protein
MNAYDKGLYWGKHHIGFRVGLSREAMREEGLQRCQASDYKRTREQRSYLEGWMHAYEVYGHLLPNMIPEVRDGILGWGVGDLYWTNDYLLAHQEAYRQQCDEKRRAAVFKMGEHPSQTWIERSPHIVEADEVCRDEGR